MQQGEDVRRRKVEDALAAWRDAQRRLDTAVNGDRETLKAEVERQRNEFQRLSADHMMERIDSLKEAESRRKEATPSTPPFHQAARDEKSIAAEIWESARMNDEDTPRGDREIDDWAERETDRLRKADA